QRQKKILNETYYKSADDERKKDADKNTADYKKRADDQKKYLKEAKKRQDDAREEERLAERALKWEAEDEAKQDEIDKEDDAKIRVEKVKKQGEKLLEAGRITRAKNKEIADQEAKDRQDVENAKLLIVSSSINALSSLGDIALGEQFKQSAAGKTLALVEIATQTAVGLISGLRIAQESAQGTGPAAAFAFPAFYATQVAAVLGAASKAKGILGGGGGSAGGAPTIGGSSSSNAPSIQGFQTNNTPQTQGGGSERLQVYVTETAIRNSMNKVGSIYNQATVG
ncbi:MAG TPA: hypothetical protein V6C96_00245, partial [Vampirovibrionales bacterium]